MQQSVHLLHYCPILRITVFPGFNHSGVIPPFVSSPTSRGGSPYLTDLSTVIAQLGTSIERLNLIQGLLDYRAALTAAGITQGFQLLDGSFTEDCEAHRLRPPSDIDLVTYGYLPVPTSQAGAFALANEHLFSPVRAKNSYSCDAYFVDMSKSADLVVDDAFYWYGLFSHQKVTATWKGMLRLSLADDSAAQATLTIALQAAKNAIPQSPVLTGGSSGPEA